MTEGSGYVIELGGEAAGLVVKEGNRFRFYASSKNYAALERALYRSPAEAEVACRRIAFPGRAPRPQPQSARRTSGRHVAADFLGYGRRTATT
jgi:hypothetical protein